MVDKQLLPRSQVDGKKRWDTRKDRLIDLHHWSDVVYLTWKNELSKINLDVGKLRCVFQEGIENEETLKVLAYVLRQQRPNDPLSGRGPL
jgi:hypothetical protein